MTRHDYLARELDELIERFDMESTKHKKLSRRYRYCAFGLTAAASLVAGISVLSAYKNELSLLILLITSVLTVVNSVEGLRKAGELWIHERTILYRLQDIRRDLQFRSESLGAPPDVDALYIEMKECLQASRERWDRLLSENPASTRGPGTAGPASSQ